MDLESASKALVNSDEDSMSGGAKAIVNHIRKGGNEKRAHLFQGLIIFNNK